MPYSNKKSAHFRVLCSFGKVILGHKRIIKPLAYLRIQAVFNAFRGKRTKPKPNPIYVGCPKGILCLMVRVTGLSSQLSKAPLELSPKSYAIYRTVPKL